MTAHLITFSPTRSSFKLGRRLVEELGYKSIFHELTTELEGPELSFGPEDTVVFSFPVYTGRVPVPVLERILNIKGGGAKTIILAVYGNRAYEDALLEMYDVLASLGFVVVAATAFVAEHSYSDKVASGRPDTEDYDILKNFASRIKTVLSKPSSIEGRIPGNHPYRNRSVQPVWAPETSDGCISCGACVGSCPMQIISNYDPSEITDIEKCLHCMACVKTCPQDAKYVNPEMDSKLKAFVEQFASDRKQPELML